MSLSSVAALSVAYGVDGAAAATIVTMTTSLVGARWAQHRVHRSIVEAAANGHGSGNGQGGGNGHVFVEPGAGMGQGLALEELWLPPAEVDAKAPSQRRWDNHRTGNGKVPHADVSA